MSDSNTETTATVSDSTTILASAINETNIPEKEKPVPAIFEGKNINYITLTSYSWCEEEWKVKIYLDFPGADKITEENMWLVSEISSVSLLSYSDV